MTNNQKSAYGRRVPDTFLSSSFSLHVTEQMRPTTSQLASYHLLQSASCGTHK